MPPAIDDTEVANLSRRQIPFSIHVELPLVRAGYGAMPQKILGEIVEIVRLHFPRNQVRSALDEDVQFVRRPQVSV